MERRALIIYCNNTKSGNLPGAAYDNYNCRQLLKSRLGGEWYDNEILSLANPTVPEVLYAVDTFLAYADYTFIVFSGHGFVNMVNGLQYLELTKGSIPVSFLRTTAARQTLIIDACRAYVYDTNYEPNFDASIHDCFIGDIGSTRKIFDRAVMRAEKGWTVLYAANKGQFAADTTRGGAYLLSLFMLGKRWETKDHTQTHMPLDTAHWYAGKILKNSFDTEQRPAMNRNNLRFRYFPIFVKVA